MAALKILLVTVFVVSCAKENPYEAVFKEDEVISKNTITTRNSTTESVTYNQLIEGDDSKSPKFTSYKETVADDVYLYIPTVESGSYYSSQVMPYNVGEERLVYFEMGQHSLKVLGHERDTRFRGQSSAKPILKIPVVHKDFKCRENSNNECSNEEEENDDISWKDKKFVELKFNDIQVQNFDSSAGFHGELMNQIYNCNKVEGVEVKSWKISEDTVDILVEKTMKTNLMCISNWWRMNDFSDQSYKITHRYLFKKLNSLASHNYKPVLYPKSDEDLFGFFKGGYTKLSADNKELYYSDQVFMNRFNPENKVIKYHLSEAHFDPKYASILEATKKAVDAVNEGLEKAGTGMKIELSDQPRESVLSDVKNSIILVEEPFKRGPLGYGPSVKNPVNGEILMAQTVMYYGNMLWTVQSAYDDLINTKIIEESVEVKPEVAKKEKEKVEQSKVENEEMIKNLQQPVISYIFNEVGYEVPSFSEDPLAQLFDRLRVESMGATFPGTNLNRSEMFNRDFTNPQQREDFFSHNNIFSADHLNIQGMMEQILALPEMKGESLKPWQYLSDVQKEKIIELMMPKLWGPVLIHELGHNLGLRHNFNGSEDEHNFYTEDEVKEMGIEFKATSRMVYTENEIERDEKGNITDIKPKYMFPYSSVMDYTHSDINALPVMGKYDIAALQFGYARKVTKQDKTKVDVGVSTHFLPEKEKSSFEEFMYCSDEGVYLNPTCNRFDEGTTADKIAEFYIKDYQKRLGRTNYKQDRLHFSAMDHYSHFMSKYYRTFFNLRKFFDIFEYFIDVIAERNIDLNAPQNAELKKTVMEYSGAVTKSADFMVGILRTVDAHCKVRNIMGQESWIPLHLTRYPTCSHAGELLRNNNLQLLGQVGQPMLDGRSPDNPNIYVDQIDVRGFWIDKLVALETLLKRKHGVKSFDNYLDNFVTLGVKLSNGVTVKDALNDYMGELIDGKVNRTIQVVGADGKPTTETLRFDLSSQQFIENSVSGFFNYKMGLESGKTHLSKVLIQSIIDNKGPFDNQRKNTLLKDYLVFEDNDDLDDPISLVTDFGKFYFEKDNEVAQSVKAKIEAVDLVGDESSDVIASVAKIRLEVDSVQEIENRIVKALKEDAKGLYNNPALTPHFDFIASVEQEILKKYLAGKHDEIPEETKKLLDQHVQILGTNILVQITAEIKDEGRTGLKVAEAFMMKRAPGTEVIEKVVSITDRKTLVTLATQSLNTKEHYEKVLSSMAQVKKN